MLFAFFRVGQAAYLQWRGQTGADAAALAAARQTRKDMLEAAKAIAAENYARAAAIMAAAPGKAAAQAAVYAERNRSTLAGFSWEAIEIEVKVGTNDTVPYPCPGGHQSDPDSAGGCQPQPCPTIAMTPSPSPASCGYDNSNGARGWAEARARIDVKLSSVASGTTASEFAEIRLIPEHGIALPARQPAPGPRQVAIEAPAVGRPAAARATAGPVLPAVLAVPDRADPANPVRAVGAVNPATDPQICAWADPYPQNGSVFIYNRARSAWIARFHPDSGCTPRSVKGAPVASDQATAAVSGGSGVPV